MPALAEGNVIRLNEHEIGVVEACSGLRMMVVFFALATAVVLVTQRHWIDKTLIIASAIPIALISNITRVTATGIMYEVGQAELAQHFFHDVAGWLMMPLALGMLWVELKVMQYLFIDVPVETTPRITTSSRRPGAVPRSAVPRSKRPLSRASNSRRPPRRSNSRWRTDDKFVVGQVSNLPREGINSSPQMPRLRTTQLPE